MIFGGRVITYMSLKCLYLNRFSSFLFVASMTKGPVLPHEALL